MMKNILVILIVFILSFGLVEAGLLNITHNITESIHLLNSTNITTDDSNFVNQINITIGLNDELDATTFETHRIFSDLLGLYRFEEGTGSTTADESGNNKDGNVTAGATFSTDVETTIESDFSMDFDGSSGEIVIDDVEGHFNFGNSVTDEPFSILAWVKIDDASGFRIASKRFASVGADTMEFMFSTSGTDALFLHLADNDKNSRIGRKSAVLTSHEGTWIHLSATYDGLGLVGGIKLYLNGTQIDTTDDSNAVYTAMHNTGIQLTIGSFENHTFFGNGKMDDLMIINRELSQTEIQEVFDRGVLRNQTAIKSDFNIALDSTNQYWLRTKKTTAGESNVSVYLYDNSTGLNQSSLDVHIVTTGWSVIPLINSINNLKNAIFRFFTIERQSFSEIQLIEEINDSTSPSIIDMQVNDTDLTCNDTIKFSANVTDAFVIDTVFFNWEDTDGKNFSQASIETGDIYTIEKTHSEITSGLIRTYNFTNATATDSVNNVNMTPFIIPYNYSCSAPDVTPPVIITYAVNNSLIDLRVTNQTINFTVTDDLGLRNITYYVYNDSGILFKNDMFLNFSEVNVEVIDEVDISEFSAGFYFINRIAYDNSNNTVDSLHRFSVVDFDTVITLLIPANNSVDIDGYVEFSYSINISRQISLYIDGVLNQTMSGIAGTNTFPSPVIFRENRTADWYTKINAENIDSDTFTFNLSITQMYIPPQPREDEYVLGTCPTDTVPRAMMFIFFVLLSFIIIAMGYALKNGLIGTLGALMMLGLGVYIWYCLGFVSILMMLLGVVLMTFFIFRGIEGFK